MDRAENFVRLALAPGIGCVTVRRLLERFGTTDAIFGADEAALRAVEGVQAAQARAALAAATVDPRPELELAARLGVSLVCWDDPAYPAGLRVLHDPPFLLYVRGRLEPADGEGLGVVGTRRASRYGLEQAERFGGLFARSGFTVVSGLARGVDAAAHRGALAAGGRTVAVLGTGLARIYPEENRDLAAEIPAAGALVSECLLEAGPSRESFPRRNRIIAGLSRGILVVEAPEGSGALITAQMTCELGREVFVLPGRIDHENSAGGHRLIRDGAVLVRGLQDILDEIPGGAPAPRPCADEPHPASGAAPADGLEGRILAALAGEASLSVDDLCERTGQPAARLAASLLLLELRREVRQEPGRLYSRVRA